MKIQFFKCQVQVAEILCFPTTFLSVILWLVALSRCIDTVLKFVPCGDADESLILIGRALWL